MMGACVLPISVVSSAALACVDYAVLCMEFLQSCLQVIQGFWTAVHVSLDSGDVQAWI